MSNMMMSRRKKKIKVPEYHAKSDSSDSSSFEEFSANLNYKYNQKPVAIVNSKSQATEVVKSPDNKAVSSSIVRSIVR